MSELHPDYVPIIASMMDLYPSVGETVDDPVEARKQLQVLADAQPQNEIKVGRVEDRLVPGRDGQPDVPLRVYWPEHEAPAMPAIVFFHGGGWVVGTLDTHDPTARHLCKGANAVVVSVDYRLAPEAKFPAAADDAYAATLWTFEHASDLGIDPTKIAVSGDSAGGNLSAVVTLMARDRGGPPICYQMLLYPVTNYDFTTPSYTENAEGYMLTKTNMEWFWRHYLADDADGDNPYASPLRAGDLSGLPPALVLTADCDPLRDEGNEYAQRLSDAGVPVAARCYPGMIHGFFSMPERLEDAQEANDFAFAELARVFA